jgi:hypothetical protein
MKQRDYRPSLTNLLISSLPDFSNFAHLFGLPGEARGQSWFENPRLLERHHARRKRARQTRRRMRRVRMARGQNLRTGRR